MLRAIAKALGPAAGLASDFILPPLCVSCRTLLTGHNLLCSACWRNVDRIVPPVCDRYGTPILAGDGRNRLSVRALSDPPVFARARAAALYTGVLKHLILRFKFQDRHEPVPLFNRMLLEAGRDLFPDAHLLMPVPLHRLRLLQRRFNQSALLAKGLAARTGIPADVTGLRRVRRTRPQVGLDQAARQANVAEAFLVTPGGAKRVAGRNVLVVDDVMTTGATLNAVAAVLHRAGAARVDVLTLALVPPGASDALDDAGGDRDLS
jgi:ComF family protein